MPDIPDFISPVDGKVVHGRAGLREHNKRNNVTNTADFKNEWAAKAREREKFFTGSVSYDQDRRKDAIIRAYEKLNRR